MLEYSVGSSMDRKDYMRSSLIIVLSLLNLSFRRQKVGQYSFYPAPENTYIFNYDEFLQLIENAKKRLLELEKLAN